MKTDGQQFLEELACLPPQTFDHRFASTSAQLGLGTVFDRNELKLLYEASLRGLLCNLAINGIGSQGLIKPEEEAERCQCEREFMEARDLFYASPGWQNLPESKRQAVERYFLSVFVTEDRLAW